MESSSNDYDVVRNMTLLFFLERLLERGQPRSLHDLSCQVCERNLPICIVISCIVLVSQFGSKGFTKTMRQIAGGSQSGLKKFLAQYPAVFTVLEVCHWLKNYSLKFFTIFMTP